MKQRTSHKDLMEALNNGALPDDVKQAASAAAAELATPGEWASAAATNVVDTGENNQ